MNISLKHFMLEVLEYGLKRNKKLLLSTLYEEDSMRNEFGKEYYLRSATICKDIVLDELMNGEYILWSAY